MHLALYDDEVGYYRRERKRVGYGRDTDFYTSSSPGDVFGELIAAATTRLLGPQRAAKATFVEIGAEDDGGILAGVKHGFADHKIIRVGEPLEVSGLCVVFSNELFDAQPFRRFIYRQAQWREIGVKLAGGSLREIELPLDEPPSFLPTAAPEAYVFDAPLESVTLLDTLCAQSWEGMFLACDYGKSYDELANHTPQGTARAYFRHTQSNDLLARPGEQDLTCHICWDWLSQTLLNHGFPAPNLESQEAFLIHHAGDLLREISEAEAPRTSKRKQALVQLIHPTYLGQKFQILHAIREPSKR